MKYDKNGNPVIDISFDKLTQKQKKTIKFAVIGVVALIFVIILYKSDILNGFISYTILGIKEFAEKNFAVDGPVIKLISIFIINIAFLCVINKNKLFKEKNNTFELILYMIVILGITFTVAYFLAGHFTKYFILDWIISSFDIDNKHSVKSSGIIKAA